SRSRSVHVIAGPPSRRITPPRTVAQCSRATNSQSQSAFNRREEFKLLARQAGIRLFTRELTARDQPEAGSVSGIRTRPRPRSGRSGGPGNRGPDLRPGRGRASVRYTSPCGIRSQGRRLVYEPESPGEAWLVSS